MKDFNNKLVLKIMYYLIRELWYDSENGKKPIKNLNYRIFEISKGGFNQDEIRMHFNFLIDNNYIKEISSDPIQYEFTDSGKSIKTKGDIERTINHMSDNLDI